MSEAVARDVPHARSVNRWALYFGWLGGAVAWAVHFAVAYFAAEFGCQTELGQWVYAGVNGVAWVVLGATVLALGVTGAAIWTAYRLDKVLEVDERGGTDTAAPRAHLARIGLITSALFAFLTAIQAIPVFFFLREC
jgi:hypothetical protein